MVSINAGPSALQDTLKIVVANAARLFEDATLLEEWERYPTAYALAVLAQEEYGKAFLVHLAADHGVPWTPELEKATRNHLCKQLVALVLEYVSRKDFFDLIEEPDRFRGASTLPGHVLSAIEIIVHEHMRHYSRAEWSEGAQVHPVANRIARGVLDREKQTGFYVYVGSDGRIRRAPGMISASRCREELARTERVSNSFYLLDDQIHPAASFDWPKIIAFFQVLLGAMPIDEFNEKWWV
jgi:AbiV family abortive infection protein